MIKYKFQKIIKIEKRNIYVILLLFINRIKEDKKKMAPEMITLYCISILVGVLSAYCSFAEASIVALTDVIIQKFSSNNQKLYKKLKKIIDNKPKYLSAIIMLNTMVNIGGSMFVGAIAIKIHTPEGYTLFVGLLTLLMLLFSEIKPKVFAARNPEKVIKVLCNPIMLTTLILSPIVNAVNGFLNNNVQLDDSMDIEELNHFISTAKETGLIKKHEATIIKNIVDLRAKTSDMLIVSNEICSMNVGDTLAERKEDILNAVHRRIILVNDKNQPVGLFFREDALKRLVLNESDTPLSKIMHPVPVIDLDTNVTYLARRLQGAGAHIAVFVEEDGSVKGVVSLTDIKGLIFS